MRVLCRFPAIRTFCITGHWLDARWKLHSAVLAIQYHPTTQTADVLRPFVEERLKYWGLLNKVTAVVTDNGANFVAMTEQFKDRHRNRITVSDSGRCAAHGMHNTVKDGILGCAAVEALVKKTAAVVVWIRDSPLRIAALKRNAALFTNMRVDDEAVPVAAISLREIEKSAPAESTDDEQEPTLIDDGVDDHKRGSDCHLTQRNALVVNTCHVTANTTSYHCRERCIRERIRRTRSIIH